jgi:hypothetical protein
MTDTPKRRGAPRKADADKARRVYTTLTPDLDAAVKADGRTIPAILRSALGLT